MGHAGNDSGNMKLAMEYARRCWMTGNGRREGLTGVLGALLLLAGSAVQPALAADDFLPPEEAFRYELSSDGSSLTVRWNVAEGYYLYKSRMGLATDTPGVTLGSPVFPRGEIHEDEYFGKQEIFRGPFTVTAPLTRASGSPTEAVVRLRLQGCADAGLCYPPQTWEATVPLPAATAAAGGIDAILGAARNRSAGADDFLPVEEAFRLSATAEGPDRVRLTWYIADGYYLYRSRLKAATSAGDVQLGQLVLPEGKTKTDEYFGTQEVYYGELVASLPVARAATTSIDLPLEITYQGCAEAGLCYPPTTRILQVSLPEGGSAAGFISEQDRLASFIRTGNPFLVLGFFFVVGLGLSFSPCMLPMVPILSGIIAGHRKVTTGRAFALSLTYVLGMALTYTIAGALFAAAGQQAQAVFQQPWIIVLFAALFVALALSMFGLFNLQMPAAIQTRLTEISNRQTAGSFGGVAVMGALSALIVTTCVAPPLVATLAVIGQSGDVVRGSAALFVMSLGMGTPLLAVGASAGKLLPRAGPWMDTVKRFFGVMMLGVAVWMIARLVPDEVALALWAVPAGAAAWVLWSTAQSLRRRPWIPRVAALAAGLYGVVLITGAVLGGTDPLAPLPRLAGEHRELPFRTIKSIADLQQEVSRAKAAGLPVMLDFYADWCVSCKEMERYTFTDEAVQSVLEGVVLLRADVTRNDEEDQALLRHFGIFGPPTIAFYGADGQEKRNFRVVGYMKAAEFAALARRALDRFETT